MRVCDPWKTTKFPVSPQVATLGVVLKVVNNFQEAISSSASMTCDELERLVQGLSTSRCFVSNFENRPAKAIPPTGLESRQRSPRRSIPKGRQSPVLRRPTGASRSLNVRRSTGMAGRAPAQAATWGPSGQAAGGGKVAEPADKPGPVVDSHSSRRNVTVALKQPTRTRRGQRHEVPIWPCSRWGLPCRSVARLAVRSCRTVSPLPRTSCDAVRRSALCCTFRRLAPPRRYLAPCPVEPGLSSTPGLHPMPRLSGRLRRGHCRTLTPGCRTGPCAARR